MEKTPDAAADATPCKKDKGPEKAAVDWFSELHSSFTFSNASANSASICFSAALMSMYRELLSSMITLFPVAPTAELLALLRPSGKSWSFGLKPTLTTPGIADSGDPKADAHSS